MQTFACQIKVLNIQGAILGQANQKKKEKKWYSSLLSLTKTKTFKNILLTEIKLK